MISGLDLKGVGWIDDVAGADRLDRKYIDISGAGCKRRYLTIASVPENVRIHNVRCACG